MRFRISASHPSVSYYGYLCCSHGVPASAANMACVEQQMTSRRLTSLGHTQPTSTSSPARAALAWRPRRLVLPLGIPSSCDRISCAMAIGEHADHR